MKPYNTIGIKRRRNSRRYKGWAQGFAQQFRPLNTEGNRRRDKALKVSMRQHIKNQLKKDLEDL